ncbi:MAG: CBS domain-containing protein [Thiobacillaceae bacterium]|jgi:CBS domain-containing protein
MLIREILTVKADELLTVSPDALIADAINQMASHDMGSLIVMDGGHMVGLITERDILRALGKHGCNLATAKVSDIMVTEPVIGSPEDSVDYVRDVMTRSRVSHLPVLDEHHLVGIISFHDVARACLKEANFENLLLKRYIKHWPE